MRFLSFLLAPLLLLAIPVIPQDASSIPAKLVPLLVQKPDMKNYLVATSSKNKVSYYIVLELDETENTQALIIDKPKDEPKLINRLPIIFPLKRFIPDDDVVKDLANQYVQFLIKSDMDGKEGIQKAIDHNPLVFVPTAPELVEAYQKAGLRLYPPEEENTDNAAGSADEEVAPGDEGEQP